jgi:hypothetical protein
MLRKNMQASSLSSSRLLFVVGIFRSGTSLLYALLNQHPQIALMYECDVLDFPEILSRRRLRGPWLARQEFYNEALSRHRLIFGNQLRGLENVRAPEDLYRAYGEAKGAHFWGEKSPSYCSRLRQLAQRHPDASFILIWRHPLEIYRSIREAGRSDPFFRRFGLNRFIFYQEQMVLQAVELELAGAKTYHVRYSDLVDRTEETCRGICRFLNLEFDPAMLNLAKADLSATHQGHRDDVHGQLFRRVIERRKFSTDGLKPAEIQKLRRFHARWRRLSGQRLPEAEAGIEPFLVERLYHRAVGRVLFFMAGLKRVLFEFLPLSWLQLYRQIMRWFRGERRAVPTPPPRSTSAESTIILSSALLLAGVVCVDVLTPPEMVLTPFYLAPTALLALTVNRRWATGVALLTMLAWNAAETMEKPALLSNYGLLLWNCLMRFLVLQFVALLLSRIRLEIASAQND